MNKHKSEFVKCVQGLFKGGSKAGLSSTEAVDYIGNETRPIQQGRCYTFDGINDFVVTGLDASFSTATTEFTGTVLIQATSGVLQRVLCKLVSSGAGGTYELGVNNTANAMFLQIIGTGSYVYWTFPVANIATQINRIVYRWVRTGTANGDLRVWVNGAEVAVTVAGQVGYNNTFTLSYNATEPLRLGSLDGVSQFLTGNLADVFQWNVALPIADCLVMSNRDKPLQLVNIGDLMFGFKCDEGGGTLAVNSLGVGGVTDGTITNANLALFHSVRTDGFGADYQNQVGFTPTMRFNGGSGTSGIALDNTANSNFTQYNAFTIHCKFVLDAAGGNYVIVANNAGVTGAGIFRVYVSNGQLVINVDNFSNAFIQAGISAGVEYHLAIVSQSKGANDTRVYLNGTQFGSAFTWANTTLIANTVRIGQDNQNAAGLAFIGWLRNFVIAPSAIWTSAFTVPTTWADYQALEATNPSKLAIYNTNIVNNPLNVPLTLTTTNNVLIPRDESNIGLDAFGSPLFYKNRVKYNAQLRQSNCLTFDGINDFVTLPINADIQLGAGDFEIECNFTPTFLGGANQHCVFSYINDGNFLDGVSFTIDSTGSGSCFFGQGASLVSTVSPAGTFAINTSYNVKFRRVGGIITMLVNNISVATTAITGSITIPATGDVTANIGCYYGTVFRRGYFQGQIFGLKFTKAGVVTVDYTMQEGGQSNRVYSRVGGHIGTMNNFAFPAAWVNRQDVVHSNLINGYEEYTDGGGGLIRVPLSSTGTSIGAVIAGFTSQGIRAGGTWHNNSETLFRNFQAPDLLRNDISNRYFTAGTPNNVNFTVAETTRLKHTRPITSLLGNIRLYSLNTGEK